MHFEKMLVQISAFSVVTLAMFLFIYFQAHFGISHKRCLMNTLRFKDLKKKTIYWMFTCLLNEIQHVDQKSLVILKCLRQSLSSKWSSTISSQNCLEWLHLQRAVLCLQKPLNIHRVSSSSFKAQLIYYIKKKDPAVHSWPLEV